jgi:PPOX class probable F420-dependent enzyme
MRARVAAARVGRLATTSPDGAPHLVPFVFALDGDTLFTSVDTKPKRAGELRRVRNLRHDARAAVLVDHYDEDWEALWWIRMDGVARILDEGEEAVLGRELLTAKYGQYGPDLAVEQIIAIDVGRWSSWSFR